MKDAVRRNPVLGLRAIARLHALPPAVRCEVVGLLLELRDEARAKADASWKRHKGPMAVYWRAVGVYAGHIARALR